MPALTPTIAPIVSPEAAVAYLSGFDYEAVIRGESYVRQARVLRLDVLDPTVSFRARVLGSMLYEVSVAFDTEKGWGGRCTCPVAVRCKHVYATLRVLLTRSGHSQPIPLPPKPSPNTVRPELPGGTSPRPVKAGPAKSAASVPKVPSSPLINKLGEVLGRSLNPKELGYAKAIGRLAQGALRNRYVNEWECRSLKLDLVPLPVPGGGSWWHLVRDELEFWQLLAASARRGAETEIPEFMEAVSDREGVEARIAGWEREATVERWRQALGRLEATVVEPGAGQPLRLVQADLQLVLEPGIRAVVEIRELPDGEFKAMGDRKLEQLSERFIRGELTLVPEAAGLWSLIRERLLRLGSLNPLDEEDNEARRWLGGVLRQNQWNERVLSKRRVPFRRFPEPLQWRLTLQPRDPGATAADYRLELTQADGSVVGEMQAILEGNPTLYLLEDSVFTGPAWPSNVLPLETSQLIPVPVIESLAGLGFLRRLGIEPPEHLAQRVQRVPVTVQITAELQPIHATSTTEDCVLTVRAKSKDKEINETWNGRAWVDAGRQNPWSAPKRVSTEALKAGEPIIIHDRTLMERVPGWLVPLEAKTDEISRQLRVRVTKNFPEKFIAWLKSLPPDADVVLKGDLASLVKNPVAGTVQLEATEAETDWFDLRVILNVDDTSLSPDEIQLLLAAKGGFVRLKGKGWTRLKFNFSEEDDERLARLGLSPHELSNDPQRLHALQLADESARRFLPAEQSERIERRAAELKARVTPAIPAGINAELRPYQLDGFHFLAYLATNRFGGILADDMGLGKTLQAITWLNWLRAEASLADPARPHQPGPTLVVCPKSVMDNWRLETERFSPGLRVRMWRAAELTGLAGRVGEAEIHVLNYSQLRQISEDATRIPWLAVILDEGQYIKNPTSQTAQIACALKARHRLILSGTPIENRLMDLWSLMAFAMPGVLGSKTRFSQIYDSKNDPLARRRLSARVRPFLLRRTKSQVAQELPARIEEDLFCELEGEQEKLYRAELKRAQQILLKIATDKHLAEQRFHLLTSLLRLRQICCHPALLLDPGNQLPDALSIEVQPVDAGATDPAGDGDTRAAKPSKRPRKPAVPVPAFTANSAKAEALMETLDTLMTEGAKVLVFSQFVGLLHRLQPLFAARGWKSFILTGETEDRGALVQAFQAHEGPAVFLISLKAGGSGLNLTAATYVVLFDPWWNPAVENQAIDRTHRIGQTQRVVAYRLLMKGTIEEKIRALQKTKSALADDVLGEEKFSQALTLSDLKYLLAD